jgi:nucleotide-binding universal stress UspA family protein
MSMKILLPVDGSPISDRAVRHVIALLQGCDGQTVFLINVQAPIDAPEVRSHMPVSEIEAMQETRGGDALVTARALLDAAGVAYTPEVLLGPVAETIARFASEQGCDQIVIGSRGLSAIGSVLVGSVTPDLVALTNLPVTLVK